ncbi:unnamed protein product, partial [Gulo gulo]
GQEEEAGRSQTWVGAHAQVKLSCSQPRGAELRGRRLGRHLGCQWEEQRDPRRAQTSHGSPR